MIREGLMSCRGFMCIEVNFRDWTILHMGAGANDFFAHCPFHSMEGQKFSNFVHVEDQAAFRSFLQSDTTSQDPLDKPDGSPGGGSENRRQVRVQRFFKMPLLTDKAMGAAGPNGSSDAGESWSRYVYLDLQLLVSHTRFLPCLLHRHVSPSLEEH